MLHLRMRAFFFLFRITRCPQPRHFLLPRNSRTTIRMRLIRNDSSNTTRRALFIINVQIRTTSNTTNPRSMKRTILRLITRMIMNFNNNTIDPLRLRRNISIFRQRSVFERCSVSREDRLFTKVLLFSKIKSSSFLSMITRRKKNRLRPKRTPRTTISRLRNLIRVRPRKKRLPMTQRKGPNNTNHSATFRFLVRNNDVTRF